MATYSLKLMAQITFCANGIFILEFPPESYQSIPLNQINKCDNEWHDKHRPNTKCIVVEMIFYQITKNNDP